MQPDSTSAIPQPEQRSAVLGRFLRGSLGSGVAVLARASGALVLNKLLAIYGGAGGLTLLAHFQNLMALFTTLPNDGVHVGLVKYLAPLRAGTGRYRAWLGAGLGLNAAALLLGFLVLAVAPGRLIGVFEPTLGWTLLFMLGITLLTGHAFLVSVLLAAGRLRAYVVLTVLLSGLGVGAVAAVLAYGGTIESALLAYLLAQGITLLPTLLLAYRAGLLPSLSGPLSRPAMRGLSRFLLMALSVLLFGKSVDFAMREVLIRQLGLAQTDLWQAVAKLSDNYTMVFSAVMGSVYYPRLAALIAQPQQRRQLLRAVLALLAPGLAVGFGLLWLTRSWLLPFLFDQHFSAAGPLLAPQLLGDWAKFLTWTLLFLLTVRARVGRYVAVQAGSAVLYTALLGLLLPRFGLLGAPMAHAVRYGLLLPGCLWYFRKELI
ncbi:polysaccharide transporter, PST family [Hymenobacter gelipurpurascens]|uniref:Polysaccharide transporter, PST family n=1 Tax=Hymenobacter gelipurpurascens TaxID=89968 RepID=A0A212TF78_9BACT|nr:hypothetical protein [Hymenobacter gelipurpurascens]SNC64494.1 polysaccharide transporter, PST family [Hymenobacter gelipurpurascens]